MTKVELSETVINTALSHLSDGFVALDLETTGLSPLTDKIIEIAAIKVDDNGKITTYEKMVNPEIKIPANTTEIHGITDSDVRNASTIDEIIVELIQFIGKRPIIAHNAKFDIGYIVCAMHEANIPFGENEIYDSCQLARQTFKGKKDEDKPKSFRLNALTDFFNIPLEKHHRAMDDALASLWIFSNCISILKKRNQSRKIEEHGLLFHLDAFRKLQEYELPEHLEPMLGPIADQTLVEIDYIGGSKNSPPQRPIRPIGFLPMPKGPVLYAQCVLTTAMKTFPIKKIHSVTLLSPNEIQKWQDHLENLKKEREKK